MGDVDDWVVLRIAELMSQGEVAEPRISWNDAEGKRRYSVVVLRSDGRIEHPPSVVACSRSGERLKEKMDVRYVNETSEPLEVTSTLHGSLDEHGKTTVEEVVVTIRRAPHAKHGPLCECDPCIHGGPTRPDNHFTREPDEKAG